MSIKIHWGAPGSYKTSGAVTDDFVAAVKAGRHIVTNVRGLNDLEHIRKVLKIPPDNTFSLHYLDTEGGEAAENALKIERFFHWMPYGAFFFLDEAPKFFPKSWRPTDIKKLDYVGFELTESGELVPRTESKIGARDENGNERPHNFITAFQQHRHYGWDMVLTSTNITNFRNEIRANAEGAFKHKNLATIGLKGRYVESYHSAESGGKNQSDFISITTKKIPKSTWQLYSSTATGTFTDTLAGRSLFSDPKILSLISLFVFILLFLSTRSMPAIFGGESSKNDVSSIPPVVPSSQVSPVPPQKIDSKSTAIAGIGSNNVDAFKSGSALNGYKFRIVGNFGRVGSENYLILAESDKDFFHLKMVDFIAFGFTVKAYSPCLVIATSIDKTITLPISCTSKKEKLNNNKDFPSFLASK